MLCKSDLLNRLLGCWPLFLFKAVTEGDIKKHRGAEVRRQTHQSLPLFGFGLIICIKSIIPLNQWCWGPQNASVGVKGSVALLCSSVCLWNDTRVLPQNRRGILELRSKWDEPHSESNSGRRRVSNKYLLKSIDDFFPLWALNIYILYLTQIW